MTSKGRQQQQNRFMSSSPPDILSDNVNNPIQPTSPSVELSLSLSQSVNEQISEDSPWGSSANPLAHIENPNDRFIHETIPPTAHSVLRTQPAFIGKLYKMLEDNTQNLICWSNNGDYFSVNNSVLFSKQILPQYFKHNNWQSFVRQLNMYGFSKINEIIYSNISFENQTWDFKHPHFKRGDFQSLALVKRKSVRSAPGPITSHFNIPGPSTITSPHLLHHHHHHHHQQQQQLNDSEINSTTFPDGPSTSSSQQHHHPDFVSIDEEGGVENQVMQLDQQVLQVSQSVTHLTSEMQDIKSLIYNQQVMIHDLAELLRSFHDKIEPSTTTTGMLYIAASSTPSSSSVGTEETPSRTTSLPSIHNLANNLRHAANIDNTGPLQQQHPYPYNTSIPDTIHYHHPSPTSSSKSSLSHQDSHPSHSDDLQSQRRRSSHPSSNNPLYPLLNTTLNPNDSYTHR